MGMTIVLADNLHRALSNLDGSSRKRVVDFLIKLQTEPHASGVRLKAIQKPRDPRVRTARVTDNLRAVLLHIGESMYVVQTVLPHDDAYRYAEQVTLTVNKATGAVEMLETARIGARVQAVVEAAPPAVVTGPPLLAHVSDGDFDRLGIPAELLPALRRIWRDDDLLDLIEPLPQLQQDVLLSLLDRQPDEVYAQIVAPAVGHEPVDTEDLPAALARPANRTSYLVVTDADELVDALAWPMERWRVYLHPTQRGLAYPAKPYSGPVRVTGGPGTGKTVVAVHRTKALAEEAAPSDRILLTTFSATLARTLRDLLFRLGGDSLRKRIEVLTTDQVARRILDGAGRKLNVLTDEQCRAYLRGYLAQIKSPLDPALLLAEWERVILDQDVTTKEAYLAAPRRRIGRLGVQQKEAVWTALEGFTHKLATDGLITFRQITVEAARVATALPSRPYRHVVVDEAQDMTAAQWRLLRSVVPPGPDDLFIVGDSHQRIYASHIVLSHHGILTRGRSSRLTVSYRTTREIVRGAVALLKGHHYDDLDNGADSLDGYRSLLRGPSPCAHGYASLEAELTAVADQVAGWHTAGVALSDIAVGVRTNALANKVVQELSAKALPAAVLTADPITDGHVHVMTLHRLKGLEYRCVALAGLRDGLVPPASTLDAAGNDPRERRTVQDMERSLVFVACTRAREALAVSWHGSASSLVLPLIMLGSEGTA